jgi:hypothetical protein
LGWLIDDREMIPPVILVIPNIVRSLIPGNANLLYGRTPRIHWNLTANDGSAAWPWFASIDVIIRSVQIAARGRDIALAARALSRAHIDPPALTDTQSTALAAAISDLLGDPLQLSPGLTAVTFQNGNNLYLAIADEGDVNRDVTISVRPGILAAGKSFSNPRIIDLDRAIELPTKESNGQFTFTLPYAASDGRMIEITE